MWYEVKVPFIHEWRGQSKSISLVCGSTYCERGKEQGSKICICYIPFERHYAWMDKISVYCITTIKFSALLETNFCSLSIFHIGRESDTHLPSVEVVLRKQVWNEQNWQSLEVTFEELVHYFHLSCLPLGNSIRE